MGNGNAYERLLRIQTKVNELVLEDKRDPEWVINKVNDVYQEILEKPRTADTTAVTRITLGLVIPGQRFFHMKTFQLTVPADYTHQTQLARFSDKYRSDFAYYNNEITDKNFARVSHQLVPGKTYAAHIVGIKSGEVVSSPDCLGIYQALGAHYTGAQGLSLAYELKKEEFPVGKWLVSFDQKNKLWKDKNGSCRVPFMNRYSDYYWNFDLGYFERDCYDDDCLLCLCDL